MHSNKPSKEIDITPIAALKKIIKINYSACNKLEMC